LTISNDETNGYVSLCYHYVRNTKENDPFPRILGTSINDFHNHIKMLQNNYNFITPADAIRFSYDNFKIKTGRLGMLITFDDGLSDHFTAAKILSEYDVKAIFFIPTCILQDNLPANPMIIHYAIAIFGLEKFLSEYRNALEDNGLNLKQYEISFIKGKDDPWVTISDIKSIFKYKFSHSDSRKILLHIYKKFLLEKYPDIMNMMHLTEDQIKKMLKMGHSIGVHTRSHISVAASQLSPNDFQREIIEPKKFLENTFNMPIQFFSYPYGSKKDCLSTTNLINRTKEYLLAFTVDEIVNTKRVSPYELGRFQPTSRDDADLLNKKLSEMIMCQGKQK
jgi:peptidoglycan/xylan/chitin deacetylase (PgdA/CDA1 family)